MGESSLAVALLVISSVLLVLVAKRLYAWWINPISIFVFLSLLHNWIGSLLDLFFDVQWFAYSRPGARNIVLYVNLAGLWGFAFGALLMSRHNRRPYRGVSWATCRVPPAAIFEAIFFALVALVLVSPLFGIGRGGYRYGEGQTAFAPTQVSWLIIFAFRAPAIVLGYAIRSLLRQNRPKTYLAAIGAELLISFLSGDRKTIGMILLGITLVHVCTRRVRTRIAIRAAMVAGLLLAVGYTVRIYRAYLYLPFEERLRMFEYELSKETEGEGLIGAAMLTDSEGVQSWVYDLWYGRSGPRPPAFGRTYVQALVNVVIPRNFQGGLVYWQAAYLFKDVAYRGVTHMGYDFAFTAEAIMNFGPYFAFLPFTAVGMFTGWLFVRWRRSGSLGWGAVYFATMAVLAITLRTDSVALLRLMSLAYLLAGVVFYLMAPRMRVAEVPAYRAAPETWGHLLAPPATVAAPPHAPPAARFMPAR